MSNTFATNSAANSAVSYLQRNSEWQSSSISKLSSGSRIVKASDDAASLAVGTKLRADVTALNQASTNASQAVSMLQIADGALGRVGDTLMRMKALATQARSDVLSPTERGYLNEEYGQMLEQIDYITTSTKFNDKTLVDGSLGATFTAGTAVGASNLVTAEAIGAVTAGDAFQVSYTATESSVTIEQTAGANTGASETVNFSYGGTGTLDAKVRFDSLGISLNFENFDAENTDLAGDATTTFTVDAGAGSADFQVGTTAGSDDISVDIARVDTDAAGLDLDSTDIASIGDATSGAQLASTRVDAAIEKINTQRANLGAAMSRFEKINENLVTTTENLDAARSVLMDVDVAAEMTKFSTNQVMTQAATAMLAQANQLPQNLMRLLQ